MAWSATRPEASIRPVPYTTSAGTDKAAAGPAIGQRPDRSRPDARRAGHAAGGRDDRGDRLGGHGCLPR